MSPGACGILRQRDKCHPGPGTGSSLRFIRTCLAPIIQDSYLPENFKHRLRYSCLNALEAEALQHLFVWQNRLSFQDGAGGFPHKDLMVAVHQVIGQHPDLFVTEPLVKIVGTGVE